MVFLSIENNETFETPIILIAFMLLKIFFIFKTITNLQKSWEYHQNNFFFLNHLGIIADLMGFSGGKMVKNRLQWRHRRHGFHSCVGKIPWKRKWQPTPVFLSEKSHGQTSLWATVQSSQRAGDPTEHSQCIYHHTLENTNTNVWERINSSPLSERFNTWDWKEKPLCCIVLVK